MKLTKESVAKDNKSCGNDWRIDIQGSLVSGSKQLVKEEPLNETQHIQYSMSYNYKNEIQVRRSIFTKSGSCGFSSTGLGKLKTVSERQTRKVFKNLVTASYTLNQTVLEELFDGVEDWNPGGVLVG